MFSTSSVDLNLIMPLYLCRYPPAKYPVLAFRGAPASFPVLREHRELQRHLLFSSHVEDEAYKYIENHFADQKFIGLHLRNGADWVRVRTVCCVSSFIRAHCIIIKIIMKIIIVILNYSCNMFM